MKFCTKCRVKKEMCLFWRDKRASDGRMSHCIDCRNRAKAVYYTDNPMTDAQIAKLRQQQREWIERNKVRYLHKKKLAKRRARAEAKLTGRSVVYKHTQTINFDERAWREKYKESVNLILSKRG